MKQRGIHSKRRGDWFLEASFIKYSKGCNLPWGVDHHDIDGTAHVICYYSSNSFGAT